MAPGQAPDLQVPPAMLLLKLATATFGLIYAAAIAMLFLAQREMQYFPSREDPAPETLGLAGVERLTMSTPDGESLVLWFSPPDPGRPTVLFLHGNAGSIAHRADRLAFYQSRGFGTAFLSWRGYGGSTGQPDEAGLLLDAETALAHLATRGIATDRVVLVAESLGTGVAVQLAARSPVGALVLEAPFTAAVDVAARAYPGVPVRWLMRDQFRSRDHIAKVRAPLLILHGERDSIIPISFGRTLFDLANQPKTFRSLGPVGHDATGDPATWAIGADFLDQAFPP